MSDLTDTFKTEAFLKENEDIADEPILVAKEGEEYAVHRKGALDWGQNSGDVDVIDQVEYSKDYFDNTPRTLEDCQQAQGEIANARQQLMTEALDVYNQAALEGHAPGALEFDTQSPDYVDDVQNALRELLSKGYLGGDVQHDARQARSNASNFPDNYRKTISENLNASIVLGNQAEELNARINDISADMKGMNMTNDQLPLN